MAASRPQQCHLAVIYANWFIYLGGALGMLVLGRLGLAALWLGLAPAVQYAYVRLFPRISSALGYGSLADRPATRTGPTPVSVTLYTAAGCPFCPVIERRLRALEAAMGLGVTVIDVTLRPDIISEKHLGAVPTVEVHGRLLSGNLTTEELVDAIRCEARAA